MADFCKECSIRIFGEDSKDLAGLGDGTPLPNNFGWPALCEGCGGMILVDDKGKRVNKTTCLPNVTYKPKE